MAESSTIEGFVLWYRMDILTAYQVTIANLLAAFAYLYRIYLADTEKHEQWNHVSGQPMNAILVSTKISGSLAC